MTIRTLGTDGKDDLYGEDSFPASDPPSTWWRGSGETDSPSAVVLCSEQERMHRAADELIRRGPAGAGMTASTARYRQFALAQLLQAVAHALERGQLLPEELMRHPSSSSQHILDYPAAPAEPPARGAR